MNNKLSEYYAIAVIDQGFGIFKVKTRMGQVIERGPVIRHYKDLNEAVDVVRDMNYEEMLDESKPKKNVSN